MLTYGGFVLLPIKQDLIFKLNTMKTNTKQSLNEANCGNKSKPLLPVVFWAHFRGRNTEADRMQRWKEGREAVTIIEWVTEQRKKLEQEKGESFVMTNCGVIR